VSHRCSFVQFRPNLLRADELVGKLAYRVKGINAGESNDGTGVYYNGISHGAEIPTLLRHPQGEDYSWRRQFASAKEENRPCLCCIASLPARRRASQVRIAWQPEESALPGQILASSGLRLRVCRHRIRFSRHAAPHITSCPPFPHALKSRKRPPGCNKNELPGLESFHPRLLALSGCYPEPDTFVNTRMPSPDPFSADFKRIAGSNVQVDWLIGQLVNWLNSQMGDRFLRGHHSFFLHAALLGGSAPFPLPVVQEPE